MRNKIRKVRHSLVVLLIWIAISGCSGDFSKPDESSNEEPMADQIIMGFTNTITENGVKKLLITADKAEIFEADKKIVMQNIKVDFFSSTGGYRSTLTATEGIIYTNTDDMDANGNVLVVTVEGTRLETEELHWDTKNKLITTDLPVLLIKSGNKIRGTGFSSDPNLKDVKILDSSGDLPTVELPE